MRSPSPFYWNKVPSVLLTLGNQKVAINYRILRNITYTKRMQKLNQLCEI